MSKSGKLILTPVSLRLMLSFSLIIIAGIVVFGFSYSYGELNKYAVEVSHRKTDALASNNSLQTLQNIQAQLKKSKVAIQRALAITASGELPQFEAINDVETYAGRNNITLKSISFADGTTSTLPTPGAAPATTAPAQASHLAIGQKSVDITIDLSDEVNFTDFLQFLSDIESNVPKMQVQGINLSAGPNINTIKSGPLTIKMYTN